MMVIDQSFGKNWALYQGDCVDVIQGIPSNSIDYIVYSPPFEGLYVYSNSDRDMGNSRDGDEFQRHYRFLAGELMRVLKPGRLMSIHCMLLPTSKQHHGYIGLRDFRGDLIRIHQQTDMIFHSEVVIWKDPVTAMQRTKALGLLYKQLKKDSAMSRQGIPDYLVTMRKPGANPEPISRDAERFEMGSYIGDSPPRPDEYVAKPNPRTAYSIAVWQRYASPVWMDINPSDTLQRESAREAKDERHIAPLQLKVIRRAIELWTNPNDLVLSPFAGIGSEGYVALELGRRFVGVELKRSYFEQAVLNLRRAELNAQQPDLFSLAGIDVDGAA